MNFVFIVLSFEIEAVSIADRAAVGDTTLLLPVSASNIAGKNVKRVLRPIRPYVRNPSLDTK